MSAVERPVPPFTKPLRSASAPCGLKLLPAYTGVASLEEALHDRRAVRLLWLEILVNDRLELGPWGEHPAVRTAYTKACRWFTTYRRLVQGLIGREPLPHDPGAIDPREYRTFAEALRFASDHS